MLQGEEPRSELYHSSQVSETVLAFVFMRVVFFSVWKWCFINSFLSERIFVGRSHVARVAEARVEQINRYCQVGTYIHTSRSHTHSHSYDWVYHSTAFLEVYVGVRYSGRTLYLSSPCYGDTHNCCNDIYS